MQNKVTVIKTNKNKEKIDKKEEKPENNNQGGNKPNQPTGKPPKKKNSTAIWIWVGLFILLSIMLISIFAKPDITTIFYNPDWINGVAPTYLNSKNEYHVYVYSTKIIVYFQNDKTNYKLYLDNAAQWGELASALNLTKVIEESTSMSPFWSLVFGLLPWIIILGGTYWIMKSVMKSQGSIGNMNKKKLAPQVSNIKFENVAGYDEVKAELWEIVDFLKFPNKYNKAGARTPKGVLLSGPPGTGKTFFAKAVAGEAKIPFFSISGSDFVEMFVGVGAKRVRELFAQAKQVSPSLIFIDELDAVGRQRGAGMGGGNDEREQTLNQILVELDGFAANTGIVVMAATNRPDVLDPALKRPGRFDRSIEFRLPDVVERQSILEIYAKQGNKVFAKDVDWSNVAGRTPGFSAAQLENVVNEAAILSIRLKKNNITVDIIDEAIDRVIGGPSKSNNLMSEEEKKLIAYHEAGHALIGLALEAAEKVQKITIIPRGQAGGYVLMTPKKEKFVQTKAELLAKITSYMAGRASEEFFFGKEEITTGAYSDIESATFIARRMVTEFGMSDLGPIQYEKPQGNVFLGRDFSNSSRNYSGQLAHDIDKEVRKLIDNAYTEAFALIKKHKPLMDILAESLLIKETLTAEEAQYIWENEKLPKQAEIMKGTVKKKTVAKKTTTTTEKKTTKKPKVADDSLNK